MGFGKVSLDKEIGGVRRTISQGEVARNRGGRLRAATDLPL